MGVALVAAEKELREKFCEHPEMDETDADITGVPVGEVLLKRNDFKAAAPLPRLITHDAAGQLTVISAVNVLVKIASPPPSNKRFG